jgi:hypothetical protein
MNRNEHNSSRREKKFRLVGAWNIEENIHNTINEMDATGKVLLMT